MPLWYTLDVYSKSAVLEANHIVKFTGVQNYVVGIYFSKHVWGMCKIL